MTEPIDREPVNDWHSDLDHFDPEFVADPYPIYEDLRGQCPVAHSDRYGGHDVAHQGQRCCSRGQRH